MRAHGTKAEEAVQRPLSVARHELPLADRYHYQITNVAVEHAVDDIRQILHSQGLEND